MAFKELVTNRFSCRKYNNEPVSREDMEYIMEWAGGAGGSILLVRRKLL